MMRASLECEMDGDISNAGLDRTNFSWMQEGSMQKRIYRYGVEMLVSQILDETVQNAIGLAKQRSKSKKKLPATVDKTELRIYEIFEHNVICEQSGLEKNLFTPERILFSPTVSEACSISDASETQRLKSGKDDVAVHKGWHGRQGSTSKYDQPVDRAGTQCATPNDAIQQPSTFPDIRNQNHLGSLMALAAAPAAGLRDRNFRAQIQHHFQCAGLGAGGIRGMSTSPYLQAVPRATPMYVLPVQGGRAPGDGAPGATRAAAAAGWRRHKRGPEKAHQNRRPAAAGSARPG